MTTKVPSGNPSQITEYLKTLNAVWASGSSAVAVKPSDAKISQGWTIELPPYEYENYLKRQITQFIAHTNKYGIPEWDDQTNYEAGKSYVRGSDGLIYVSVTGGVGNSPTGNTGAWKVAFEPYGGLAILRAEYNTFTTDTYRKLTGVYPEQARNNLNVYSRDESDNRFARLSGDTSRVFNVATPTADSNAVDLATLNARLSTALRLAVGEEIQGTTPTSGSVALSAASANEFYLKKANLLSDFNTSAMKEAARNNLGLDSAATKPDTFFFKTANIFAELDNATKKQTARNNLGLGSIATLSDGAFFKVASNLSELVSESQKSAARLNLGLGTAATKNVSTGVGGVAASDDTRIVNAVQKNYILEALAGLTGGGALSNVSGKTSIGLGTPSTISKNSANSVGAETHSHALDILSFFGGVTDVLNKRGYITMPSGIIIQWGYYIESSGSSDKKPWAYPFPNNCFGFIPVQTRAPSTNTEAGGRAISCDKDGFVFTAGNSYGSQTAFVIAIGN